MTMWVAFALLMAVMLAVDLGLNRKSHAISFREALCWSVAWVALAMLFNVGIWYTPWEVARRWSSSLAT